MTGPKDLSHFFSEEAKSRKNSPLKSAFKYWGDPNIVFLGGGLPLSDYFPWTKITAESPAAPFSNGIGAPPKSGEAVITEIHKDGLLNAANEIPLSRSLQYGFSEGQPELIKFAKEHTKMIHKIPYEDWDLIATIGSTESWDSVLRTFTNRGDTIITEEFTFSSALETASALGVTTYPTPVDDFGIIPEALDEILDKWVGAKPKLLYTIPTGQNPTGSSLSKERRVAIYKIAQKHDFIIIEDEPYYFLQMPEYTTDVSQRKSEAQTHEEFVDSLVPSFISLDVDGRVLRLDSFSKVLGPGLRFGWVIGQPTLLERILRLHEVSVQAPAGLTQSIINGLLQRWGQEGYLDWLIGLRAEYTIRRDATIDAVEKYFPKEISHYNPPVAGMFFTISFDASKHPKFATEYDSDPLKVEAALFDQSVKEGALLIPGSWFKTCGQTNPPQPEVDAKPGSENTIFFRGTYAAVSLEKIDLGLENFSKAVKVQFGL